jgi:DNA invertase Pin-like site-specific DNA recombinase
VRAAVYLRQSLDRDGKAAAVARQREDCLRLCTEKGWQVVEEFVDNDVSASSGRRRPGYEGMLAAIRRGAVDALVVWDLDRLTRRPIELEEFIVLADKRNLALATATGDTDLSTDNGRLFARIKGAVARAEVERKGERQRRAARQAAQQGRPAGGHRPSGYEPDGTTIRKDEAQSIRQGFRELLAGASLRGIAARWNDAGFRTTRGGPWRPDAVRYVLRNARYAGLRSYKGETYPASWRGIVDEATWRAASAILDNPARRTSPDTRRRYMLSGLARCFCGALVDTGRSARGVRTYKCSAHKHLARGAETLDEYIAALVVERLRRPDAAELLVDDERPDVEALRDEAQSIRSRLEELAGLYAESQVTAAQLTKGTAQLRRRLSEIEGRMAHAGRVDVLGALVAGDVERVWAGLDVDRRRAVIDALMTITLLSPGRGARTFDPATVKVAWRGPQR